jgi:L-lactate dehydrogenase (cytochrome)
MTDFLPDHPGGAQIILKYGGRDATSVYDPIHPREALNKHLPPNKHLGPLDSEAALVVAKEREDIPKTKDQLRMERAERAKPPLSRILSVKDMENIAGKILSYKAFAYYSSASDDEITNVENARAFSRFFFHPRVMRALSYCDPSTTILGFRSSIPVFVSGAALAKLGHPLGEVNITLGASSTSLIQMVSSNASLSPSDIISAASPSQTLFFQLYKHSDDAVAQNLVRELEQLGYKAIFLTVDAIVYGNRERDIKAPWVEEDMERGGQEVDTKQEALGDVDLSGTAGALVQNDDRAMTWEKTIPWLRSLTKLPIVIKGIQCVEDCVLAADAGVDGILLSNHGGRQLEYSLPPIEVLYRLRQQRADVFDKLEVYIDGGITRGTAVLKALCLGATAVGLGRPFLYAQSAYGAEGVVKLVRILEREILTGMRLLGAGNVKELKPQMVERVDWQPLGARL